MSFEPNTWKPKDKVTSAHLNRIEQGIAAFYPQKQIIAPEQTVTITSETTPQTGVPITLAEGIDLSTFSEAGLHGLSVSINGEVAERDGREWLIEVDGGDAEVFLVTDLADEITGLAFAAFNPETQAALPGDYTVEIMRTVAEIPMLGAFPVVAGETTSAPWVVDAAVDEVDVAKLAGCVLLYAASPNNRNGFAFGIIVGGLAYYVTLTNGSFEWHAAPALIVDGKYAITAFT